MKLARGVPALAALLLVLPATVGAAVASAPAQPASPLVALWQVPAAAAMEADFPAAHAPRAVLYEDGTAISLVLPSTREPALYRAALAQPSFVVRRLGLVELGAWFEDVATIAATEDLQRLYTLEPPFPGSAGALFHVFAGGRTLAIGVRGLDPDRLDRFGAPKTPDAGYVPPRLLRLYQDLARLADATAREWEPTGIELHLHPAPPGSESSIDWPPAWTDATGDGYSANAPVTLRLPGRAQERLAALLPPPVSQHVVRYAGRPMTVTYRFMFPGEAAWGDSYETNATALRADETNPMRDPDVSARERALLRESFRRIPSQADLPK